MPDFKSYRSITVTPIHIGGTEPPEYISPQEIVLFDGRSVVKRENGDVIKLNNPRSFHAVIKAGWVVPSESKKTRHRPRAAGVQVHEAAPRGKDRQAVALDTVADEQRSVGDIGSIRNEANTGAVPETHVAARAGEKRAPMKRRVIRESEDDGKVVGRIKTSAQAEPALIGRDDNRLKKEISGRKGSQVEKRATATGDVQEALAGSDLEDLLPDAASARPPPRQYQDEGVTVSSSESSVGGAETGEVVRSIKKAAPLPRDVVSALRDWVSSAGDPGYTQTQLKMMVRTLLRKFDAAYAQAAVVKSSAEVPAAHFEWDMEPHWKTRESSVYREHSDDVVALRAILEVDKSKGVVKAVNKCLGALGVL